MQPPSPWKDGTPLFTSQLPSQLLSSWIGTESKTVAAERQRNSRQLQSFESRCCISCYVKIDSCFFFYCKLLANYLYHCVENCTLLDEPLDESLFQRMGYSHSRAYLLSAFQKVAVLFSSWAGKKIFFFDFAALFPYLFMLELVCCFRVVHQSANDANSVMSGSWDNYVGIARSFFLLSRNP